MLVGICRGGRQSVPISELTVAIEAVKATEGVLSLVIDAQSVVDGIRAGPHGRHSANKLSWKLFWTGVGDRPIEAHAITSHLSAEEARANFVPPQHWLGNKLADELADEAARQAQLPPQDIAAVSYIDAEAAKVHEHLLAVATEVTKQAPSLYGASSRQDRAQEAK
eukprot:905682-Pyramimonas_sp.AAC.2